MKNKTYKVALVLLLFCSFAGLTIEYARYVRASREYAAYETRVETGLLARLAATYIAQNNLKGFEYFCLNTFRYQPDGSLPSENNRTGSGVPGDIFVPPPGMGLQTRISLFDVQGKVLFDSWHNASSMENHSDRPEFKTIATAEKNIPSFYSFERYSTTVEKKMFFCITSIQVGDSEYFLRTGNTIQSLKFAGHSGWKETSVVVLFLAGILFAIIALALIRFRFYRNVIIEIEREISPEKVEADPPSGLFSSIDKAIRIIKGGVLTNREMLNSEKNIRDRIFQSLNEGVVLLDSDGMILDINESACQLLGTRANKAVRRSLFGIWRNTQLQNLFEQSETTDKSVSERHEELVLDLPEGKRWVDVQLHKMNRGPSSPAVLLLLYDLTKIRRLENYRKEFVANVSHEIKTPLTVIMGTVEALQDGALNDSKQAKSFLETIVLHSKRLYALVRDVLSLSNLESCVDRGDDRFEMCSILEPLELALADCESSARENGFVIELEDNAKFHDVRIDSRLMEQAFVNLIDNAVKYSASNDPSSQKTNDDEDHRVIVRLENRSERQLAIMVIDHGPGIPLEHQPRIFERFYRVDPSRTASSGGTGLGLAIVKHIVQLHGGTVTVENNSDRGCTFTVLLNMK